MMLTVFTIVAVLSSVNSEYTTSHDKVVFSASLGQETTVPINTVVRYDKVLTNIGNAYNSSTGVFTAPRACAMLMVALATLVPAVHAATHNCQNLIGNGPSQNDSDHCTITRCSMGYVTTHGEGCRNTDGCHPLGYTFADEGCTTRNCTNNGSDHNQWEIIDKQCRHAGICYSLGSTVQDENCSTIICTRNDRDEMSWTTTDRQCRLGSSCYPLGVTGLNENCETINCTNNYRDELRWAVIDIRQCRHGDSCYPPGFVLPHPHLDCFTSNCTYNLIGQVKWVKFNRLAVCHYTNSCYPLGSILEFGYCRTYRCATTDSGSIEWVLHNMGCRYNRTCYDVGAQIILSCSLYQCMEGPRFNVSMQRVETYCMAQGKCFLPGVPIDWFYYNGNIYDNCTCSSVSENSREINCNEGLLTIPVK